MGPRHALGGRVHTCARGPRRVLSVPATTRPVRHGRPGRTQRLLAILATLVATGLIGAAAGATREQAARHYFGSDPVELGLARAVAAGNAHQVSWLVAQGADPDSVG